MTEAEQIAAKLTEGKRLRCSNCGLLEREHYRGPYFLHCPVEATEFGDDDCTYCPEASDA